MGYAGVEYAGLHGYDPVVIANIVADCGMTGIAAHMTLPTEETLSQFVDDVQALRINRVVSGGGPAQFADKKSVLALAERFQKVADLIAPYGIEVGFHNHWREFDHLIDGECPHDIFMKATKTVFAELDIFWACFGGADPVDVVGRNHGRVKMLQVKDGYLIRVGRDCLISPIRSWSRMSWSA